MNIAFVSAVLPYPLHSGGQVRIYNLLKRLSKKHDITLYAFIRNKSELQHLSSLSFCKKIIPIYRGRAWQISYIMRALFSSWSFLYATYEHAILRDRLQKDMHLYDLIHIEPGYVFPSIPHTTVPIVVGEHNIEHEVYEGFVKNFSFALLRPFLLRDVNKMKQWEHKIWNMASHVIAVSDEDASYIRNNSSQKNVSVVPNGVDIEYFHFVPKKIITKKSMRFLYVGNFAWIQNSDAIRFIITELWGEIQKKYPGATFTIVGKHFPEVLRSIHAQSISVVDSVEDIRTVYANADVLLAPIRIGGGTRYKILEAMASGLPVITSTLGASGLNIAHDKELYIADTIQDVLHCIDALSDTVSRKKIVVHARAHIKTSYSWETIALKQDSCWRSV